MTPKWLTVFTLGGGLTGGFLLVIEAPLWAFYAAPLVMIPLLILMLRQY